MAHLHESYKGIDPVFRFSIALGVLLCAQLMKPKVLSAYRAYLYQKFAAYYLVGGEKTPGAHVIRDAPQKSAKKDPRHLIAARVVADASVC
ncbi:MAG: hypothetical protein Q3962_07960 [Corynebacterium sp.]|nr:hypothetical protein [Corynebacterium sp.]